MLKETALAAVASDILATSVLFDHLTRDSLTALRAQVAAPGEAYGVRAHFARNAEEHGWRGELDLAVDTCQLDTRRDEETGDLVGSFTLNFNLSWSSNNSAVDADMVSRLNFMATVASEVNKLREMHSATHTFVVRTAVEEAERVKNDERAALLRRVKVLAEHPVKGLRAHGNHRQVDSAVFAGIPMGTYEVTYHFDHCASKTYQVQVRERGCSVWRTA